MTSRTLRQQLSEGILALDEWIETRPSRFGGQGDAFWIGRRELAHFHPCNELDLRLTKPVIRELKAELEADPRVSWRASSDWIEVRFSRKSHLEWVLELVARALAANR